MGGANSDQMAAMNGDVAFHGAALGGGQAGMSAGIDGDIIFEAHDHLLKPPKSGDKEELIPG